MDFKEAIKTRNRMCRCYKCCDCPMGSQHNGMEQDCVVLINDTPELAEPILEKWAEENKPLTNAEKLKEIFPNARQFCPRFLGKHENTICYKSDCPSCKYDFWNATYEEPKQAKE